MPDECAGTLTEAAIAWMERLLGERFGLEMWIQSKADAFWELGLHGQEGNICIETSRTSFAPSRGEVEYSVWTGATEGWTAPLGLSLPAPGRTSTEVDLVEFKGKGAIVHYDLIGLIYWMLTRQEEVGCGDFDEHGRFASRSSHAVKHKYLDRPIVDEWLMVLGEVIQRVWPRVPLKRHAFHIRVSHDVDHPSRYGFRPWPALLRAMVGDIAKRQDLRALTAPWVRTTTKGRLHRLDPYNTFDWIMSASEARGLVSAFYFIPDAAGTAYDGDYELDHPAIRELIRRINNRGHEAGLHPSYNSYLDPLRIMQEAAHLRRVCGEEGVTQSAWGGRMHYLRWRQPTTLRAWVDAGMAYDSTLTYADQAGFRCGTCFEYEAFDPVAGEALPIRIRPLIVMEGSVIGAQYMNLGTGAEARHCMLDLKRKCKQVNGVFTLLWHNSSFLTARDKALYLEVLDG